MAYQAWSVTQFEEPSVEKWNILGTNDADFNTRIGVLENTVDTGEIHLGDNKKIYLGDSDDVGIYYSGTALEIESLPRTIFGGNAVDGETVLIELGMGRTGNGYAILDFIGDETYTDYGTRLIRNNTGANTSFDILHRGTGGISIVCQDGGGISIPTPINYAVDAQANDTYVIALSPVIYAYYTGQRIIFKANTANTGAATININGLGAKTIVKRVNTTLANNDILAGMICDLIYDGTNFVLLNPVVN